ncbi:MAG: twin-arginine translocase TatA/TatE family subunit [Aquificota bacterium]|mgnify:FL=1|jgi:sec-independent protein translocase protein TatA|nr:twin-arginine translocase TatA/TatE family subunit [Aquificaceae bacterium]QWK12651.1 MAG: twin-arginine translocase TatA/TatE family subunit [Aquificota bacterium]HCO38444.1 twin-arginine translocase TatA/TatE family subunit [Aquificaceae bacterium]
MIPHFSFTEILLILFVVFVLFGAGKLPEVGRALGEGIRNFKKAISGEEEKVKEVNGQEIKEKEKP